MIEEDRPLGCALCFSSICSLLSRKKRIAAGLAYLGLRSTSVKRHVNRTLMNVQRLAQGDFHEVVASGRIDGEGANQLEVALVAAIAEGAKRIHVNLSGATFISSPGLRALLQGWRNMHTKGGDLHVVDPSPEASALLNTSGFQEMVLQKA